MTKTTNYRLQAKRLMAVLGNLVRFANDKDHREKARKLYVDYFYRYPEINDDD